MNRIALPLLLLGSIVTLALGCAGPSRAEDAAKPRPATTLGPAPQFELTDQSGETFSSDELRGRVWIATLIFTRCGATCPIQSANLARLRDELRGEPGFGDVRFVSISVDPEHDRPERLREYAARYDADPERWKFLTGDRGRIREIASGGFHLPVMEDDGEGIISHSAKFVLVDGSGGIVGYYEGVDKDEVDALKLALREMLAGGAEVVYFPEGVEAPEWVEARRDAQLARAEGVGVLHDFGFTDVQPSSGIDFLHRTVDDAGKTYKPVHYDHGNSVSVADVDGDGLPDVYFVSQVGPNGLFRNRGDGTFEDITARAGVALPDRVGVAASFADIDNDGDADLYVTSVRGGNSLFRNRGDGTFEDVSSASGLDVSGHCSGTVFFDYDRDGLLDALVTVVGVYTQDNTVEVTGTVEAERLDGDPATYHLGYLDAFAGHLKPERIRKSRLFRNEGEGRFREVTEETGLADRGWTGDASPTDFDEDGWPDLYMPNMQGHDGYWENREGKFVQRSRDVFPRTPWGTMGIKSFDFDNDGDLDLFLTDMHSDMSRSIGVDREKLKADWIQQSWPEGFLRSGGMSIFGNAFYRNRGDGTFEEISDSIGAENYWPWGLSVGDLNADGWQDAFVASGMGYPFRYGPNTVLLNDRGKALIDAEYVLGVEPRRGGRTAKAWFELACGGADSAHALCKGRSGDIVVHAALSTRSSVLFDIDDDGDLDIVTGEFGDVPQVLRSDLAERRGKALRFVKVKLVGTASNRDGLGARVVVAAGEREWTRVHDGQSGYLAQSRMPLYFGLGDASKIDSVRVHWPSGRTSEIRRGLTVGGTVEIVEPDE